jgi:hypothetical protein
MTPNQSLFLTMHSKCWFCREPATTIVSESGTKPTALNKGQWRAACEPCRARRAGRRRSQRRGERPHSPSGAGIGTGLGR